MRVPVFSSAFESAGPRLSGALPSPSTVLRPPVEPAAAPADYVFTERDARQKINDFLGDRGRHIEGGLVLIDERTLTKPYGCVFFYNSRRYLERPDILHAIGGSPHPR